MKLICLLAAVVAATTLTTTSQARSTPHHRWSSMTTVERRAVAVREIRTNRAPVRWWVGVLKRRFPQAASPGYPLCRAIGVRAPGAICSHGQRLVHALRVLRRIDARIAAAAAARAAREAARARATAGPAHLAGWLCIHNGRGPGYPHEGTGWNPSHEYSGPLQMGGGWGGYPVSDWNALPEEQVYEDAEVVAAAHGFDYSWMAGQWPRTFPPCADLFG